MNKGLRARIVFACLVTLTAFPATSCIYIGSHAQTARCEKEVPLSAPLPPGSSFSATTGDGSINVVDLKGSAKVETSYGSVICENFSDGDFYLKSGNGRITLARGSVGECDASSSYGAIGCNDVKGKTIKLSSGNGSINIVCSASCPAELKAEARSDYGSIDFTAPPQFAGRVHLSTQYGSVRTALPVTVSGEIDKKSITGTIGQGAGALHLETNNGSVELK